MTLGPDEEPTPTTLPRVLRLGEMILRAMGVLGWDPATVKAMELWEIASFLGEGDDDERVLRGSRMIEIPDDGDRPVPGGDPPGPNRRPRRGRGKSKTLAEKAIERAKVHERREAQKHKPDGDVA